MSIDIMVDLETLGTRAGCGILSIGACTFDEKHTFYRKVLPSSGSTLGLTVDDATMEWWNKQHPDARRESFSGVDSLTTVLGAFADWYRKIPAREKEKKFIWGNGADFDLPILQACYIAAKMKQPWDPFNGRCYRTLKNLYFDIKMDTFEGQKHTALADAINQAAHARKILRAHFNVDKD